MSNRRRSDDRFTRSFSNVSGWMIIFAGVWFAIGLRAGGETDANSDEPRIPFETTARDDHRSPVWSLTFSPDNAKLAAATMSGDIWIKTLSSGDSVQVQRGKIGSARSLAFSDNGETLVAGGLGMAVQLFNASTGEQREPLRPNDEPNTKHVTFSQDGRHMAMSNDRGTIGLWDWKNRRELSQLKCHRGGVSSLALSSANSLVAAGNSLGQVTLWDSATGTEQLTFPFYATGSPIACMAFSPDGKVLVTAGFPAGLVQFWDPLVGRLLKTLPKTATDVRAVAFSPDGSLLAMARDDGSATFWDVEGARELGSVQANSRSLLALAFSGDGRLLATGGMDGCIRLWDVNQTPVIDSRIETASH